MFTCNFIRPGKCHILEINLGNCFGVVRRLCAKMVALFIDSITYQTTGMLIRLARKKYNWSLKATKVTIPWPYMRKMPFPSVKTVHIKPTIVRRLKRIEILFNIHFTLE